jgi:hypothetical protein
MLNAQCDKPETYPHPNAHAIAPTMITATVVIMRNRIQNHAITPTENNILRKGELRWEEYI